MTIFRSWPFNWRRDFVSSFLDVHHAGFGAETFGNIQPMGQSKRFDMLIGKNTSHVNMECSLEVTAEMVNNDLRRETDARYTE